MAASLIAMRANIKLLDFHYILNAPRIDLPVTCVPINVRLLIILPWSQGQHFGVKKLYTLEFRGIRPPMYIMFLL